MKIKFPFKKNKLSPEKQYYFLTAFFIILAVSAISIISTRSISNAIVNERGQFVMEITQKQIDADLSPKIFEETNQAVLNQKLNSFFGEIKTHDIVRMKVYDSQGKVIYSTDPSLVGKTFPDDNDLQAALKGKSSANLQDSDEAKDEDETAYPSLMEIYMPFSSGGIQKGVFEFYYDISGLDGNIIKLEILVDGIIISTSLLLLLAMILIYRRSAKQIGEAQQKEIEAAKNVSKLKDEFVFVAAHELSNPATVVKGFISLIEEEDLAKDERVRKYFSNIKSANEQLINIINELLEVARNDSGTLKVETSPQSISEIIKESLDKFKILAEGNKIDLQYKNQQALPDVIGNKEKLKEVIDNLVSNAIKYNKPAGKITISHEILPDRIITHVADTGLGIREEDKAHLFERFHRCHTDICNVSGTGLGLFIVKELITRMGGKIWAKSEFGKGSTFSFELPIAF